MTKKIYVWAILLAFVMQSMNAWSKTSSLSPVCLYNKHTPKLDGNPKPSKAPANFVLTLSVFIDEDSQQLVMYDPLGETYAYYIYNENEEVISQGVLDFSNSEYCTVDLWTYQSGTYVITIIYNGYTYSGTFEMNKQ